MKRTILITPLLIFALSPGIANPALSPYLSAKVNFSKLYSGNNFNKEDPLDFGLAGAVGLQYKISKQFDLRSELEISSISFNSEEKDEYTTTIYHDTYEYKQTSYMTNFYFDRDRGYKIKPYVMAGFGIFSFNESAIENVFNKSTGITTSNNIKNKSNSFGFAFGAGFSLDIVAGLKADLLDVRYTIVNKKDSSVTILSFGTGLRYVF